MNSTQEQWKSAGNNQERLAILAKEGKRATVRFNRDFAKSYQEARTGIWPFCVAKALVRSTHARDNSAWYPAAAQYLRSGSQDDLLPARAHSCSFGPDALQRALTSFRTLGEFTGISAPRPYDAARLVDAQTRAVQYAMKRELTGLGAWLFCAPFELMALLRPSLWEDPRLDGLLLPLGSALARGYGILQSVGMVEVDEALLRDSEPGIRNGLTLLYIARGSEEKLAQQASTRALFIHQGIYELGQAR